MIDTNVRKLAKQTYDRLYELREDFRDCDEICVVLCGLAPPTSTDGVDIKRGTADVSVQTSSLPDNNDKWEQLKDCAQKLRDISTSIDKAVDAGDRPERDYDISKSYFDLADRIALAMKAAGH